MAIKYFSRLEANREVRRILVRNGADTAKVQFSCHGRAVNFTGSLLREGGKEMEVHNVENIFQSLFRLGFQVHCEFDNWTVTDGMISKKSQKNNNDEEEKVLIANSGEAKKVTAIQEVEFDIDEILGIEKKKKK